MSYDWRFFLNLSFVVCAKPLIQTLSATRIGSMRRFGIPVWVLLVGRTPFEES